MLRRAVQFDRPTERGYSCSRTGRGGRLRRGLNSIIAGLRLLWPRALIVSYSAVVLPVVLREFLLQDADAFLVLTQRRGALAGAAYNRIRSRCAGS